MGVNANLNGTDAQWQPVLSAMRSLGVRHMRDTAASGAPQAFFDRHAQLGQIGVKSIFTAAQGTSPAALERFAGRVSADIEGLEAPSGLDATSDAAWVQHLRSDVSSVHTSAKALGLLTFGPTLASAASYSSLGDLSALEDFAGFGSLPCAGVAEQTSLSCAASSAKQMQGTPAGQPFFVSGATPAAASQLPPAVAAIYLPRVLLEEWNAGAKRSYRADLDVASTSDFALLDRTGAETPAFRALSGLLSLLKDSSGAFQPGTLAYSISGVDSSVHHALFQKGDGSFYLALWIEAPSYDAKSRSMLSVAGQVAKLETGQPMSMTSYQFDETGSATASNASLSTPQMVPVSDRLLVIRLTPQSTQSAAATTASAPTTASFGAASTTATPGSSAATAADDKSTGAATFYISSSGGDDGNDGLSDRTPWKTIAKLNASTGLYKPGTSILLKRGDVFRDDYIRILNKVNAGTSTTLANTPLPVAGTSSQPIIIGAYGTGANPLIDGADPINGTWTRVTATTWKATVASLPSKLYVDSVSGETAQLMPQANAVGAWQVNTPYHYLDLVTYNGKGYLVYGLHGTIGTPSLPYGQPYLGLLTVGAADQAFSVTKSGLSNVENTPGSWYGTGTTVYVHLRDGTDPNAHVIEGSNRPYGVLLMSVNYVTVENLSVERPQMLGIALGTWTDNALAGHYTTNEYNSVLNSQVWNWGNLGSGCLTMRHTCSLSAQAGILSEAYGDPAGAPLRGNVISGNYVGRSDQFFGLRSTVSISGIAAIGQNGAVVSNNRIVTINNQCLNYQQMMSSPVNMGGDISYNFCGNNQGNFFFGGTVGGRLHHNIAANSYGEGIQLGGNDQGGMIDHNLLYNLDRMASTVGYNGIDCNGGGSYMTMENNTIVNVWGAAITLEHGCDHAEIVNNVFSMPRTNGGTFFYYLMPSFTTAKFHNNLYSTTVNVHPWRYNYRLAQWKIVSGEADATQKDPAFVNPAVGDFRLVGDSTGVGSSQAASSVGSVDQGADLSAVGFQ